MSSTAITSDPQRGPKQFKKVIQSTRCSGQSSPHFRNYKRNSNKTLSPRIPIALVSVNLQQLQHPQKKFVKVMSERYSNHSSPHFHRRKTGRKYVNEKVTAESVARAHRRRSDPDRSVMARQRLRSDVKMPKVGDSTADGSDDNKKPASNAATIISCKKQERKVQEKVHKKSFRSDMSQAKRVRDYGNKDQAKQASSSSMGRSNGLTAAQTNTKSSCSSTGSKSKADTLRSSSYVEDNKCTIRKGSRGRQDRGKTKKGNNPLRIEVEDSNQKKNQRRSRGGKQDLTALQPARRGRSLSPKNVVKIPQEDSSKTRKQRRSKSMPPRQDMSYRLRRSPRPAPLPRARLFTHRSAFNGSTRVAKGFTDGLMKLFGTGKDSRDSHGCTEMNKKVPRESATKCDGDDFDARGKCKKRLQKRDSVGKEKWAYAGLKNEGDAARETRRTRSHLAKSRPRRQRTDFDFRALPLLRADAAKYRWEAQRDTSKKADEAKHDRGVCMQACSFASTSCSSGESNVGGNISITEMYDVGNDAARNSSTNGHPKAVIGKHVHASC